MKNKGGVNGYTHQSSYKTNGGNPSNQSKPDPQGCQTYSGKDRQKKTGLNTEGGVILGSNAFYGEKTKGTWILKVLDSVNENTGTIELFKLNIMGY